MNRETIERIQPTDTTDTETAVRNTLEKRAREARYLRRREARAEIRTLMRAAEAAFAGETDRDVDEVLSRLQETLSGDARLPEVLSPEYDGLEAKHKINWRRLSRRREAWRAGEDVEIPREQEYRTYVAVGIALGTIHSGSDKTRYAPVYLPPLDIRGARSPVEGDPTPIGRVRIGADSTQNYEDRETEIPHIDCEHVLVIANPREGKDALISRMAGNLKDEHGYKWVALHDDGRNETPMIATPNDEEAIIQSLESFGQEPKGYRTKVYVPAVGLPDRLPANHEPFTIGVESLSPELIAQLSGVNPEGSTERRIKYALEETGGSVDELIRLLEKYAEETSAEITVTELRSGEDLEDDDVSSKTRTYEMGEDKILHECAQSLMLLASEGLLRDRGAETNLDMTAVLEDQEHVAVLNCNFLPDGDEHLKYLLENIWLRLINLERDRNPWLPRVAIEIREIKNLAPSVLERARYTNIVKSLRQTIFHLSSQGGSRRIMLLGSTQYIRDVYKPVRGNMPIKVLLKMGSEKIQALEGAGFNISQEERYQLNSFDTGWGMLLLPEGKTYPINWSGPRCGLGLGDMEYLDRYGLSSGFRVQLRDVDLEAWEHDAETYIDERGRRREAPPDRREWYLLEEDLEAIDADLEGESISEDVVLEAARARQEYPVPQDLRLDDVDVSEEQRTLSLLSTNEAEERERKSIYREHDIPGVLREWTRRKEKTVRKFVDILEAVEEGRLETYPEIEDATGVNQHSIRSYASGDDGLGSCLEKKDGVYRVKPIGRKALKISWGSVFSDIE